jgi:DNA-binding transcriptional LysR family regulator
LRVLAGLAQGLTVTEIGERLSMGHSSVSKALHAAETRAGFTFVEQRGRRIQLTSAGQVLGSRAQRIVQDVDDINQLADGMRAGSQGLVRIVASATPADYLLPPIIGEFIRKYPDVRVVLRVSPLAELHRDLADGEFDIGVGPPSPMPSGWESEPLYDDAMTFVVAPGSPLAQAGEMAWAEVRKYLLIGQFREPYWSQVWGALTRMSFDADHVVELRTAEAIKRLVEESDGVGVLARSAVEQDLREGRLVELRISDRMLPMPYVMFSRPGQHAGSIEREFRALVRARLASKPPGARQA